jgi:hypothetical protein
VTTIFIMGCNIENITKLNSETHDRGLVSGHISN